MNNMTDRTNPQVPLTPMTGGALQSPLASSTPSTPSASSTPSTSSTSSTLSTLSTHSRPPSPPTPPTPRTSSSGHSEWLAVSDQIQQYRIYRNRIEIERYFASLSEISADGYLVDGEISMEVYALDDDLVVYRDQWRSGTAANFLRQPTFEARSAPNSSYISNWSLEFRQDNDTVTRLVSARERKNGARRERN